MCFDTMKDNQFLDTGKDPDQPTTPAQILSGGLNSAASTMPPRQTGLSKGVNNPVTQGAAGVAGAALAPATGGLSLLIPVVTKVLGGLLSKKPAPNFGASLNTGGDPNAGLNALSQRSFGGY